MLRRALVVGSMTMAIVASALPAEARTTSTRAPYQPHIAMGSSLLARPCTVTASPVPALAPDPESGSIDISEGLGARRCAARRQGMTFIWRVPTGSMAGRAGTVTLRVRIDGVTLAQRGTAQRDAGASISAGGSTWSLGEISCEGANCSTSRMRTGRAVLRAHMEELPEWVEIWIEATASLEGGTGAAGVAVRGRLSSVHVGPTVQPIDPR